MRIQKTVVHEKKRFSKKKVTKIIEDTSRELGITRRPHDSQEILDRSLCSMVNVGFVILEEGYADKPSDIDVIYMFG